MEHIGPLSLCSILLLNQPASLAYVGVEGGGESGFREGCGWKGVGRGTGCAHSRFCVVCMLLPMLNDGPSLQKGAIKTDS
jgi:hypothetical protein